MSEKWMFPWEREAVRGAGMPDGLSLPDQMAYTALRCIYSDHREKRLSREQAAAEKSKLRYIWEKARSAEAFDRKLTAYHVRQIKAQEAALCACRKNPTPENAERLCRVLDGLERPDLGEGGTHEE